MKRLICVPGAKVPIVKIWDPEYKVACDMNVNNTMAIENTRMIKTYVEIDDRVRPLALIIKNWTKQRLLNDAGELALVQKEERMLTKRNSNWRNFEFLHLDMSYSEFFANTKPTNTSLLACASTE